MNAADARDALANGDAADQQAAVEWMEQPRGADPGTREDPMLYDRQDCARGADGRRTMKNIGMISVWVVMVIVWTVMFVLFAVFKK